MGDIALTDPTSLDSLTLSFQKVGADRVRFVLKLRKVAWLGFGISKGAVASMTAEGEGADVVVCSDSRVQRYSVTGRSEASFQDAGDVEDASCTHEGGSTIMAFTRTVAA